MVFIFLAYFTLYNGHIIQSNYLFESLTSDKGNKGKNKSKDQQKLLHSKRNQHNEKINYE